VVDPQTTPLSAVCACAAYAVADCLVSSKLKQNLGCCSPSSCRKPTIRAEMSLSITPGRKPWDHRTQVRA